MFSVRIITADYYMSRPHNELDPVSSLFRGSEVYMVPIIRVFGTTSAGQKVCLHIHGVFPYFYIPFDKGSLKDPISVANSVDATLNQSLGKNSKRAQHVYNVTHVSGIPMYGFYESEFQFLKVFFYNPVIAKKTGELLLNCNVTGTMVQPHEAHVPYVLQFFMDFNLQGMNLIHLSHVKFRKKTSDGRNLSSQRESSALDISSQIAQKIREDGSDLTLNIDSETKWTEDNIPGHMWLEGLDAISSCELEVDAVASDILNQLQLTDGVQMNPGLSALWDEERSRRETLGIQEDVELSTSPLRSFSGIFKSKSDLDYFDKLKEKLDMESKSLTASARTPFRSMTGHDVTFAAESVDELLTPATLVDVHVEGELSRSLGLSEITMQSQNQQSQMMHISQDISLDQSDMDMVGLLEELQFDRSSHEASLLKGNPKPYDQDSVLGSQLSGRKEEGTADASSSEDEMLLMTQTHWADESFAVIGQDGLSPQSSPREGKREQSSASSGPGPFSEKESKGNSSSASGNNEPFEAKTGLDWLRDTRTSSSPLSDGIEIDESDEILDRSDESDEERNQGLLFLDGTWDSSSVENRKRDDGSCPEESSTSSSDCNTFRSKGSEKLHFLDGQFDSSSSGEGTSPKRRRRRKVKNFESRLSRSRVKERLAAKAGEVATKPGTCSDPENVIGFLLPGQTEEGTKINEEQMALLVDRLEVEVTNPVSKVEQLRDISLSGINEAQPSASRSKGRSDVPNAAMVKGDSCRRHTNDRNVVKTNASTWNCGSDARNAGRKGCDTSPEISPRKTCGPLSNSTLASLPNKLGCRASHCMSADREELRGPCERSSRVLASLEERRRDTSQEISPSKTTPSSFRVKVNTRPGDAIETSCSRRQHSNREGLNHCDSNTKVISTLSAPVLIPNLVPEVEDSLSLELSCSKKEVWKSCDTSPEISPRKISLRSRARDRAISVFQIPKDNSTSPEISPFKLRSKRPDRSSYSLRSRRSPSCLESEAPNQELREKQRCSSPNSCVVARIAKSPQSKNGPKGQHIKGNGLPFQSHGALNPSFSEISSGVKLKAASIPLFDLAIELENYCASTSQSLKFIKPPLYKKAHSKHSITESRIFAESVEENASKRRFRGYPSTQSQKPNAKAREKSPATSLNKCPYDAGTNKHVLSEVDGFDLREPLVSKREDQKSTLINPTENSGKSTLRESERKRACLEASELSSFGRDDVHRLHEDHFDPGENLSGGFIRDTENVPSSHTDLSLGSQRTLQDLEEVYSGQGSQWIDFPGRERSSSEASSTDPYDSFRVALNQERVDLQPYRGITNGVEEAGIALGGGDKSSTQSVKSVSKPLGTELLLGSFVCKGMGEDQTFPRAISSPPATLNTERSSRRQLFDDVRSQRRTTGNGKPVGTRNLEGTSERANEFAGYSGTSMVGITCVQPTSRGHLFEEGTKQSASQVSSSRRTSSSSDIPCGQITQPATTQLSEGLATLLEGSQELDLVFSQERGSPELGVNPISLASSQMSVLSFHDDILATSLDDRQASSELLLGEGISKFTNRYDASERPEKPTAGILLNQHVDARLLQSQVFEDPNRPERLTTCRDEKFRELNCESVGGSTPSGLESSQQSLRPSGLPRRENSRNAHAPVDRNFVSPDDIKSTPSELPLSQRSRSCSPSQHSNPEDQLPSLEIQELFTPEFENSTNNEETLSSETHGYPPPDIDEKSKQASDYLTGKSTIRFRFKFGPPPSYSEVKESLSSFGLEDVHHRRPFWGDPSDVKSESAKEIGGVALHIDSCLVQDLPEFEAPRSFLLEAQDEYFSNFGTGVSKDVIKRSLAERRQIRIVPVKPPPSYKEVEGWLFEKKAINSGREKNLPDLRSAKSGRNGSSDDGGASIVTTPSSAQIGIVSPYRGDNASSQNPMNKSAGRSPSEVVNNTSQGIAHSGASVALEGSLPPQTRPKKASFADQHSLTSVTRTTSLARVRPSRSSVRSHINTLSPGSETSTVVTNRTVNLELPSSSTIAAAADISPIRMLDGHPASGPSSPSSPLTTSIGTKRPLQVNESTPQTTRKRRVSWDSNLSGNQSQMKRKRLGLFTKIRKRRPSRGLIPFSPEVSSQKSFAMSPILRHAMKNAVRRGSLSQSQICDPALKNSFGFKLTFQNLQNIKSGREYSHISTMLLEVFVPTRGSLRPDPDLDEIGVVFYSLLNDTPPASGKPAKITGCILNLRTVRTKKMFWGSIGLEKEGLTLEEADDEIMLLLQLVEVVRKWDPDILVGYEIEMLSWGYVCQRGKTIGLPIHNQLSRLPSANVQTPADVFGDRNQDPEWESYAGIQIPGRIVLNLWRLMKEEIPLQSYTFENMAFHVLHQRVPLYSWEQLSDWWKADSSRYRRVKGSLEIIEQLNLIGRTSELARLFGIQFFEVFSRGSQWRVESLMLRLAKAANMVSVSPSMDQRARMKAPEWLPLIMEPMSRFYVDPVLVLDFQSLYPSVMIANNYCFSTCLGRLQNLGDPGYVEFGCTYLRVKPETLRHLVENDLITFSPAGIAFVRKEVRPGILPRMLNDILETRLMVKQSMKLHKDDSVLQRVLHSRQLGLKLIANVTYGYTSANFSGRMPAVEVGDSVVAKGRETLERAIALVQRTSKWGAKVIYGDTDSMFVQLPGKTREEAFRIGEEIAEAVTLDNPKPVKLKFEKVYHPCILQTKKRYVGYMYEKLDQQEPVYEAKGIETVRRDGCPATVKILEKVLRILFETKDVSQVKSYVQRQFSRILSGAAHLQDFVFAKEFRGRSGYKPGASVPALEIAKKLAVVDPRAEPRSGERVPYVIVYGPPGLPLIRLVRSPHEVLSDPALRLNANYYISKVVIPPLNRCLSLIGADPASWYEKMQRPAAVNSFFQPATENRAGESSIASFFKSMHCVVCDAISALPICSNCRAQPDVTLTALGAKLNMLERKYFAILRVCGACSGDTSVGRHCMSLDCPLLYKRRTAEQNHTEVNVLDGLVQKYLADF